VDIAAGFVNDEQFEFLEIQNTGSETIDLTGVELAGGVSFSFTGSAVTSLGPGEYVLVVADLAAFAHRYESAGLRIAGAYTGRLSNGGEELQLLNGLQLPIQTFSYDDAWYPATDGQGNSLEVLDPRHAELSSWNRADRWAPSLLLGGTPGEVRLVPGDSNHDGRFNSSDLVLVFQAGKYEDAVAHNTTFEEGDWNGDGDFTTSDLVLAFQLGTYVAEAITEGRRRDSLGQPVTNELAADAVFGTWTAAERSSPWQPPLVPDVRPKFLKVLSSVPDVRS
jgi:hypothetical protein